MFIHGRLNDPMTGGSLYCRIRAVDGALVEYEQIHHRADGSELIGAPWRLPIGSFIEETFGGWFVGSWPRRRRGKPLGVSLCRWTHGRSGAAQLAPDG